MRVPNSIRTVCAALTIAASSACTEEAIFEHPIDGPIDRIVQFARSIVRHHREDTQACMKKDYQVHYAAYDGQYIDADCKAKDLPPGKERECEVDLSILLSSEDRWLCHESVSRKGHGAYFTNPGAHEAVVQFERHKGLSDYGRIRCTSSSRLEPEDFFAKCDTLEAQIDSVNEAGEHSVVLCKRGDPSCAYRISDQMQDPLPNSDEQMNDIVTTLENSLKARTEGLFALANATFHYAKTSTRP